MKSMVESDWPKNLRRDALGVQAAEDEVTVHMHGLHRGQAPLASQQSKPVFS
jgi:hypothetical protein